MIYGFTLRLPEVPPASTLPDQSEFVNRLRTHFCSLKTAPSRSVPVNSNISPEVSTSTHVFVRHDAARKLLQPPCDGPYAVVQRTPK